jgi:outer membrane protein OmpA-like peptidoglycan-associated protein
VAITFALPAPTRFDRLAVPNVAETPSPLQTFFRDIAVFGATDPAGPWTLLAQGRLTPHETRGEQSELTLTADRPEVTLVQVQLRDGMDVQRDATFFEFSEIIGNGTQQAAPLATGFSGVWKGRGVDIELAQQGATVSGCYDKLSPLSGTVEGNVLRAIGTSEAGIASQFILVTDETGALRGLRSTNGAPFKLYDGEVSGAGPRCTAPEPPRLGCGAIVHGIGFDFDSDVLRPSSAPVLEALHAGLSGETAAQIRIVGHSSSEGAADYNLDLSQRRAASVVRALVAMGLPASRLSASGRGEEVPIASNADEAGRSLNRRVEIECAG